MIAGRFALCDPIGSGGSGTVWRAYDYKLRRYCAAKLLRQREAGDLLRFVREQSVRLDHPHIVSPYSWVAEDGTVLIASELMSGGSLHTLIGDFGPLAEGTVATILGQVLSGLQAVHDAELIHRDVKPANLLLRATGTGQVHVVLADFGLTISRRDARLTQVGMVIGTPGYLPPEVLLGRVSPDPRHDLYAAGRLALTMITGTENIGSENVGTENIGTENVGTDNADSEADVIESIADPALRRTVDALLRHDPQERPPDASAAAALLAAQLGVGSATDHSPLTRDGDLIEVLDQLPPLPPGWGLEGPLDVVVPAGRTTARATIIDVAPTASAPIGGPLPMLADRQVDRPVPVAGSNMVLPPALPTTQGPRPPRRRGPLLAAIAVVAVLMAGLVLVPRLLPDTGTGDPSPPPTTTSPSSMGTTPISATEEATGPETATAGPAATGAVIPENLSAGDGCTWQQEGDRRTGAEGAPLVCTLDAGIYQWRSPG